MTIEEKAKRYKEIIDKLRKFYRDYDTVSGLIDVKEELANLIPELEESEDEKLRKEIVSYLKNRKGYTEEITDPWIAWLEKQSEEARNIALRTEYEKGRTDTIAEMLKQIETDNSRFVNTTLNKELKFLRPQKQWKPTQEQIVALRWVLNSVPYNKHKEIISGLLDQIKDL